MDPISPELVLIDPELARRARARLPDYRESNGNVTSALADAIARAVPGRPIVGAGAVAPPVPPTPRSPLVQVREAAVSEVETQVKPRRALGRMLLLVAAGLFIFLLAVLMPRLVAGGDPAPPRQLRAAGEEQPAAGLPRSPTSAGSSLRSTPRASEPKTEGRHAARVGDRVSAKREAEPRRGKAPPPRKASSPPTSPGEGARMPKQSRVPTRLLVWLPSRGASYYHVQFFKGRRTLFEAWPTDPRVTVPLRGTFRGRTFAFTNGRYRWIVRPAFGPRSKGRDGEAIVRSIWVVRP